MLHYLISATILLQALVSPAVGVAHCHAGMTADEAQEHQSQPHVHVHQPELADDHTRHHHKKAGLCTGHSMASGGVSLESRTAPAEHDGDAVYLDKTDSVVEHGTRVDLPVSPPKLLFAVASEQHAGAEFHTMPALPGGPPRYLCNLVLRL